MAGRALGRALGGRGHQPPQWVPTPHPYAHLVYQPNTVPLELQMRLWDAINATDAAMVRQLLCDGASPAWGNPEEDYSTPLHRAAFLGSEQLVRILLEHHANVDARDQQCWTPLMGAAINGHLACARVLLESKADVDALEDENWNALHFAAGENHEELVRLLIAHKAELERGGGTQRWSALHVAVDQNHVEVARLLLDSGASLLCRDTNHQMPLGRACARGHIEMIKMLVMADAPSRYHHNLATAIHAAIRAGNAKLVQQLLELLAELGLPCQLGLPALTDAISNGGSSSLKICRLLLESKAVAFDRTATDQRT